MRQLVHDGVYGFKHTAAKALLLNPDIAMRVSTENGVIVISVKLELAFGDGVPGILAES